MSFVLLIIRRPPRSTRTATLFPYTSLFLSLGKTAASLGTLGAVGNGFAKPVALTTPDPVTLYRTVAQIASMGIDRLAIEASSPGLSQHRLDGLKLTAAAFTTFSRAHPDSHGSLPAYLEANLRLFSEILPAGPPAPSHPHHT